MAQGHPIAVLVKVIAPLFAFAPVKIRAGTGGVNVYTHWPMDVHRSRRGLETEPPVRVSTVAVPPAINLLVSPAINSFGNAACNIANAAVTCGAAIDVPRSAGRPAALTYSPGASNLRNEALFDLHVTCPMVPALPE